MATTSTTTISSSKSTEEKDTDLENRKIDYKKALDQLRGRKACFTSSNSKIFANLHIAAAQKAAQVLGINQNDPNLGQFIINTGMSKDGRYVADDIEGQNENDVGDAKEGFVSKLTNKATEGLFGISNGKYEIGIVLQFTEYKAPLNKDIDKRNDEGRLEHDDSYSLKQILDYNYSKGTLKKYRDMIFEAMQEYLRWFNGQADIQLEDMTEFIPDYDGGKVQIQGGEIKSMGEKEMVEYLMSRRTENESDIKAVKASGGEKVKTKDKDGHEKEVTANAGQWIINNNRIMDDSEFTSKYEETKTGSGIYRNKEKDDEKSGEFLKPRLGYKIGYKIKY